MRRCPIMRACFSRSQGRLGNRRRYRWLCQKCPILEVGFLGNRIDTSCLQCRRKPSTNNRNGFFGGTNNFGRSAGAANLSVNVVLTKRRVVASFRKLRFQADEQALSADDDVGQPSHHVLATVHLEAEPALSLERRLDLAAQATLSLCHLLLPLPRERGSRRTA